MAAYANNLLEAMAGFGYGMPELLAAFPGRDLAYVEQVQRDNANALNRPVVPYGMLGVKPCATRYFNVGEFGVRLPPEPQPWPPQADRTNVFVFGGSTVVGYYVEDGDTIPALMQRRMDGGRFRVYNLGGGNYTSRMAFLRLLSVIDAGMRPDVAVFIDGYNDCFYGLGDPPLAQVLDGLYQDEKRRRRLSVPRAALDYLLRAGAERRRALPSVLNYSTAETDADINGLICGDGVRKALLNAARGVAAADLPAGLRRLAASVWSKYLDNVGMIRLLGARHGIKTLFCWQPVPYFRTNPRQRIMEDLFLSFAHGAICGPVYHWLQAENFPGMAGEADFRDLSGVGEDLDEVAYVDVCHYSPAMAAIIADHVTQFVDDCLAAQA